MVSKVDFDPFFKRVAGHIVGTVVTLTINHTKRKTEFITNRKVSFMA